MAEDFKKVKSKRRIFTILVVLLSIPMLVHISTSLFHLTPMRLNGSFTPATDTNLTIKTWFSGDYSKKEETFLNQNFGFRPFFVQVFNQIDFSLYNQIHANDIIMGKNGYLFEKVYIDAWTGTDYVGDSTISKNIKELVKVNDTLRKKGIRLILLLAPGKAFYMPENIPNRFKRKLTAKTNYEAYRSGIKKTQVALLDFHQWFQDMKDTATYPLYPQTGTHWSKYGELLVMDSLLKYLNTVETNYKVPSLKIEGLRTSRKMWDTDNDIEKAMNLLFPLHHLKMAYAMPIFEKKQEGSQPKVLTIADSYYWGLYNYGLSKEAFDNGEFWYYNNEIYPQSFNKELYVTQINIKQEVEKNNVVLIVSTDENLKDFTFRFISSLYKIYYPNDVE